MTAVPLPVASPEPGISARGRFLVIYSALVAALAGLLFGYDTAVISGTTDALQKAFGLNNFWLGFTVATAIFGTILGSLLIGRPADAFGRKKILFAIGVVYFVSAIGCGLSPNWGAFLTARLLGGLAIGGASVLAPLYIAEIAPPQLRGRLVGSFQLNVVIGILLSFTANYIISGHFNVDIAWRWMLGILAFPALVFFLLMFTIPESPRWLVRIGRAPDAQSVLDRLGEPKVAVRIKAIEASLADKSSQASEGLYQRRYAWPIFLACAVAIFNQLSGINALMYYAPMIFELAGAGRQSVLLQSVAIGIINLVFTIVAMFVIDRIGRRMMLLVGSVGTALCLVVVAWQFDRVKASGPMVLAALLGYIAFFAFSSGAVVWVFISEIFPNAIRARGQALGSFANWTTCAAVSWVFPVAAQHHGSSAFGFFAAMMVLQLIFAWKLMPETKGRSLEDIKPNLKAATIGAGK